MTGLPQKPPRFVSLDLLRGLDVWLMLFVNEMAGVPLTPLFLRHAQRDDDFMTLTDVVFPAFLFVVGMAIPLALGGRLLRGEGRGHIARHVLARSFALIVMGVFMVNAEEAGRAGGALPPPVWNLLATLGLLLVWQALPKEPRARRRQEVLRALGAVGLVALALVYRNGERAGEWFQFHHSWWGILGLIGWSYMVGAAAYLLLGENLAGLTGLVAVLYCVYLADAAGHAPFLRAVAPFVSVGSMLGSHGAIVVSGVILGVMVARRPERTAEKATLARTAFAYSLAMVGAGVLLHTLHDLDSAFHFSKILATPSWCLVSSGATAAAWSVVYVVTDVWGFSAWPKAVFIAGENALLAYLVAPFLLSLFDLLAMLRGGFDFYQALAEPFLVGTVRSLVFAWLVVRLCGLLRRAGVRLQV